jgi:hypothetical protein
MKKIEGMMSTVKVSGLVSLMLKELQIDEQTIITFLVNNMVLPEYMKTAEEGLEIRLKLFFCGCVLGAQIDDNIITKAAELVDGIAYPVSDCKHHKKTTAH